MYSVQIAVSDGTLTRIALSIEYFEKDDVTLYRNLELTPLVLDTDWQWDGDTHINLLTGTPVPVGSYITVRRNTNIDRAFNIYDGGAAFSRDTLDENFKQMIYLAQEFTEGNGLTGLFFPLDMHGFQIKNLGNGTAPKDAVNKGQLDAVDDRVTALEDSFIGTTNSYPWYLVTTVETDTFTPGFSFTKAVLYLDGVCQTPEYSYIVVSNQILLADPIPVGTMVFARLGEDVANDAGFATASQLSAVQLSLENTKANKGSNSDITSLSGLTTPLSIVQGGTGATTQTLARTALGAATSGVNADVTALTALSGGITGLITGATAVAGVVGEVLGDTAAASATVMTTGVTANTHSLVLTPGEWYVEGAVQLAVTAPVTATARSWGISTVSATLSTNWWDNETTLIPVSALALGTAAHAAPGRLIRVSVTTTVYLVANITFSAGTTTARGYLRARRMR